MGLYTPAHAGVRGRSHLDGRLGAFTAEAQSEPANAALVQGQNIAESCDKM